MMRRIKNQSRVSLLTVCQFCLLTLSVLVLQLVMDFPNPGLIKEMCYGWVDKMRITNKVHIYVQMLRFHTCSPFTQEYGVGIYCRKKLLRFSVYTINLLEVKRFFLENEEPQAQARFHFTILPEFVAFTLTLYSLRHAARRRGCMNVASSGSSRKLGLFIKVSLDIPYMPPPYSSYYTLLRSIHIISCEKSLVS